jgi:hypothetical protein
MRDHSALGGRALAAELGAPLEVERVEALIWGTSAVATETVDIGPPEDDVGGETRPPQKQRPTALSVVALGDLPAVPHGRHANRLYAESRRALRQLEDHARARRAARQFDTISKAKGPNPCLGREDPFGRSAERGATLRAGLKTRADPAHDECCEHEARPEQQRSWPGGLRHTELIDRDQQTQQTQCPASNVRASLVMFPHAQGESDWG